MKLNKKIKILVNYVLGPLLFLWLSYSLYTQVTKQSGLQQAWEQIIQTPISRLIIFLSVVFFLMLVNWLIEAVKWQIAIRKVQSLSLFKAFKAILSGVSFSATTPNRVGEYAGRVLFLDAGNRLRSIALTIVCSMSQLIITVFMGSLGLAILINKIAATEIIQSGDNRLWIKIFLYGSIFVLLVLLLFYFRLSILGKLAEKIPWLDKHLYLVKELEVTETKMLMQLLVLSFIRFMVFCLQYWIVFRLFNVEIDWWQCLLVISVVFLILAVIPSFAIAELGIRGEVTWRLMQLFTANALGVTLTIVVIWFINLILPAFAGSLLIAGVRLFKKKDLND